MSTCCRRASPITSNCSVREQTLLWRWRCRWRRYLMHNSFSWQNESSRHRGTASTTSWRIASQLFMHRSSVRFVRVTMSYSAQYLNVSHIVWIFMQRASESRKPERFHLQLCMLYCNSSVDSSGAWKVEDAWSKGNETACASKMMYLTCSGWMQPDVEQSAFQTRWWTIMTTQLCYWLMRQKFQRCCGSSNLYCICFLSEFAVKESLSPVF